MSGTHNSILSLSSRSPLALLSLTLLASISLTSVAHAGSTHDYELNGTFSDANSGPSLVSDGGILGATGYTFGPNQGLSLSNALDSSSYSIDVVFSVDTIRAADGHNGYVKLIDFQNRSSDSGLYIHNGFLNYFGTHNEIVFQSATQVFSPNTAADLLFTRNAAGTVTGSVDGVQQFSFVDTENSAIFSTSGNLIRFFEDDTAGSQVEAAGGFIDSIKINSAPVPEASTTVSFGLLLALGLGGVMVVARKKKRTA